MFFFALVREMIFIKTHSTGNRFVIKPETILFLRCVRASFTGWGSEGVKGRRERRRKECRTEGQLNQTTLIEIKVT